MFEAIQAYNDAQSAEDQAICNSLAQEICRHLPEAEYKIWHSHPVLFLDGKPGGRPPTSKALRSIYFPRNILG